MRVLILTGSIAPETGGIAAYVRGFARGLAAHGIEVSILAATAGASRFSGEKIPVSEFDLPRGGYVRRVFACRSAVRRTFNHSTFDRVIISSWSPYGVALPSRPNRRPLPFDIMCHGMDLLEPARSFRYRWLLGRVMVRASRVIANSQFTAEIALRAGAAPERLIVVHPGIDTDRFFPGPSDAEILERHQTSQETLVLLSVGRLVERKGFDRVIQCLPEVLRHSGAVAYWIVGDGPDLPRLKKLAYDYGVSSHVRFAGNIPDEDLPRYYRASHLFVMPSRHLLDQGDAEGFGIVYLEAACSGLPVIGGRSGGVGDAIVDGKTGVLVDPEDTEKLALAVRRLLEDPKLRQDLGRAGRSRAVEEFSWPKLVTRYVRRLQ